ncbi:putative golgin subfamily A member 8I [Macaca fascicularis]|uniref:putative golgin subfamily A member 8I n=1 Tax=Macaca fascicularis TaxID=9541 RepID=UPI0032B06FF4
MVKKYWQRNSPGVPAGAKRNRKTNGSGPETATADGCHSPGDSATGIHREGPTSSASLKDLESLCQELAVVLDSRSVKISQLNNIIKSLVRTLKKEKKHDTHRVEKLERSLSKQKPEGLSVPISKGGPLSATHSALYLKVVQKIAYHLKSRGPYCLLPFSAEPLPLEPPAVPSEVELQHLRKEVERMAGELQAQVDNNQRMSERLQQQEERLQQQEERLQEQEERLQQQEERLQQLAEPQSGFEKLNNENKSALQLEQQERLETSSQQNQPLQAQLSLMVLPGEGDGGGHLDSEEEEAPQPMPTVPEDLESWEAMVAFFNPAGASAQEEQAQFREQVTEHRVCCQRLAHLVSSAQQEPEAVIPAPVTGGESLSGETHRVPQEVMEKLESGLMDLLEKVDLREWVEKLQLRFIQNWKDRCHQ